VDAASAERPIFTGCGGRFASGSGHPVQSNVATCPRNDAKASPPAHFVFERSHESSCHCSTRSYTTTAPTPPRPFVLAAFRVFRETRSIAWLFPTQDPYPR